MIKYTFLFFLLISSIGSYAQNYAHLNLGNLLAQLPEVESADQNMKELRDSMKMAMEGDLKKLEAEFAAFQKKVAEGNVAPLKQQEKSQFFQEEQQKLMQREQSMGLRLEQRRQRELAPILQKIDQAIKAIATEKGYSMVFDVSGGALLHVDDSKDIESEVLSRLQ